jgi:lipoyl-dependent peroxiredoxin
MAVRVGEAQWKGNLENGNGRMRVKSGRFESPYSAATRFQEEPDTNPEELIGAAHAGCFSMALSQLIAMEGFEPEKIDTKSRVHLEKKNNEFSITGIDLTTKAIVKGISNELFMELAAKVKQECPVSRALSVPVSLEAALEE